MDPEFLGSQINCVFLTSTKGHFGHKDIYQETFNRLVSCFGGEMPVKYFVHVKKGEDDSSVFEDMKYWFYNNFTIDVFSTVGKWAHSHETHAQGIIDDMFSMSMEVDPTRLFTILHEDDWWHLNREYFFDMLHAAVVQLLSDPFTFCVRIPRLGQDTKTIDIGNRFISKLANDCTEYGPTVTFQPTIFRTVDFQRMLMAMYSNKDKLDRIHCEMLSTYCARQLMSNNNIVCVANQQYSCEHIGEKDYQKKLELLKQRYS